MGHPTADHDRLHTAASTVVAFLGISQGVVPLITRGFLNRNERLAPASWLSAPWWWIACLAIIALALSLIAVIEIARPHQGLSESVATPDNLAAPTDATQADPDTDRSKVYDSLSGLILLIGLYNGIAPFVTRLIFDVDLLLVLPLRLPTPWWWITSLAVLATTNALLAVIDQAKPDPRP
jgi:hypothetical protein